MRMKCRGTGGYHRTKAPWTMLVPLGLLSIGAVFAGLLFHGPVHRRA
jgi:NADH-quinone oxidoreductase subunit L